MENIKIRLYTGPRGHRLSDQIARGIVDFFTSKGVEIFHFAGSIDEVVKHILTNKPDFVITSLMWEDRDAHQHGLDVVRRVTGQCKIVVYELATDIKTVREIKALGASCITKSFNQADSPAREIFEAIYGSN